VDSKPLWTAGGLAVPVWRPARPPPAHRKLPTGENTELHHPAGWWGVEEGAKLTLGRSLASGCFALDLPDGAGASLGQPAQITLCRASPVHRGYRLRGVWCQLSLPLCASSVGATRSTCPAGTASRGRANRFRPDGYTVLVMWEIIEFSASCWPRMRVTPAIRGLSPLQGR